MLKEDSVILGSSKKINLTSQSARGTGWCSRYSASLRAGRSGDRIPVWTRFSAPVQTGPGVHPTFYTIVTASFPFPAVKRPWRGVDHPPHLTPRLKKSRAIHLLLLWAFVTCSRVTFTFPFIVCTVI